MIFSMDIYSFIRKKPKFYAKFFRYWLLASCLIFVFISYRYPKEETAFLHPDSLLGIVALIYLVSLALLSAISGFIYHRGVNQKKLATLRATEKMSTASAKPANQRAEKILIALYITPVVLACMLGELYYPTTEDLISRNSPTFQILTWCLIVAIIVSGIILSIVAKKYSKEYRQAQIKILNLQVEQKWTKGATVLVIVGLIIVILGFVFIYLSR